MMKLHHIGYTTADITATSARFRSLGYEPGPVLKEDALQVELCYLQKAGEPTIELVRQHKEAGVRLFATGEMGIGNTTTASAVACVLLGQPVETMTGRGAGLSDEGLRRKKAAIAKALAVNAPDPADPLGVLAAVGGFDIAGMCGAFLGGALYGVPVLADGVISAVAALLAVRLCPAAAKAVVASHVSAEPAGALLLAALGKKSLITAEMRLGEGSGCPIAFQVLEAACAILNDMATFDQAGIDDSYLEEIRKGDKFTVEAKA